MPWAGPATLTEPTSLPTPLCHRRARPRRAPAGRPRPGQRVPVSATLAANEALASPSRARRAGAPAGLRRVRAAGASAADRRARRHGRPRRLRPGRRRPAAPRGRGGLLVPPSLPTSPDAVIAGPGSKALLFATLLALGTDVAVPRPSWVSYAAQATLIGAAAHFVPLCRAKAAAATRPRWRRRSAPAGALASPSVRCSSRCRITPLAGWPARTPSGSCAPSPSATTWSSSATRSTAIWYTIPSAPFLSPAAVAPERTVVTTALSKNLAVGGWRIGVARMPDGPAGAVLRERVLGIASEIWSAAPVRCSWPPPSRSMSPLTWPSGSPAAGACTRSCARQAARLCTAAGLDVMAPQAAFYLYPDFAPWRDRLRARFGVATGADLAALLLDRYGAGTLPGSAFGESASCLRLRAGDRPAVRRHRRAAGAGAGGARPAAAAVDQRALDEVRRDPGRPRRPGHLPPEREGVPQVHRSGAASGGPASCCPASDPRRSACSPAPDAMAPQLHARGSRHHARPHRPACRRSQAACTDSRAACRILRRMQGPEPHSGSWPPHGFC